MRVRWLAVGAVVVAAAVVATLVVTLGGGDEGGGDPTERAEPTAASYDLSSPRRAAESFVAAARARDGAALFELTCMADPGCLTAQGEQVTSDTLDEAKQQIVDGVYELAEHLDGAELGEPAEASLPGTTEVPYRTPAMGDGEPGALIFVEHEGEWRYVGSSVGGSPR